MPKKLEFKDKDQKRKCWLRTVCLTAISMFIFFFTWLFCEVNPDFFSVSIFFLIVFWQFYTINKYFITLEYSNKIKIKTTICSLLFLLILSLIFVILGEKSYPHYFDVPAKIATFVVIPFVFLVSVANFFIGYFNMSLTEKKLTFLYLIYIVLFSIIVGVFLTCGLTILFTITSSLIIGLFCVLFFLGMVLTFNKLTLFNKKKQVRALGFNLLILLISFVLGGSIYFWIVNKW